MPFAPKTNEFNLNKKLMGVYVPKEIASHLTLSALSNESSVSDILRNLIHEYIGNEDDPDKLLKEIATKAHDEWKEMHMRSKGMVGWKGYDQLANRWEDFKKEAKMNLKKKKIYPDIIDKLMAYMEQLEIRGE